MESCAYYVQDSLYWGMPIEIDRSKIEPYSKLEFLARQVVEGFITGLHKSPFHGFSVEFAEHRLYNTGESTRHIDWKLYGRTEKLFVKRYEEETNLRCQMVIDRSSSMFYPAGRTGNFNQPDKFTFSVYAAAALINLLKRQRDAFGLTVFDDNIEVHTDAKSNRVHERMIYHHLEEALSDVQPNRATFAVDALHEIAERVHKRSLVIIFSDMLESEANEEEIFDALQHLRHNKHEVVIFHTVHGKSELDFDFENRPYKFVDLETGEELKLNPNEVKEKYVKQMRQFEENLKLKCGHHKIDFVEAHIDQGFDQVLLPYLLKRQKLY